MHDTPAWPHRVRESDIYINNIPYIYTHISVVWEKTLRLARRKEKEYPRRPPSGDRKVQERKQLKSWQKRKYQ